MPYRIKAHVQGVRVYRKRCQSPGCESKVAAVATFKQRCAVPLSVRYELCDAHTVLEIFRHADLQWSARISTLPGRGHDGAGKAPGNSVNC